MFHEPTPRWLDAVRDSLPMGQGVVVAVSGGGDSVGLLRALHRLGPERALRLTVAHLDHGVRGAAAEADAAFVAALADRLGLPFELGRWSPMRPGHFEADARAARYAWLADVARERGASAVAVGHNRDDQAETILHRILRGTGPRGLAGMPARRALAEGITLIRPLLDLSRREIRDYLAAIGQDFREDDTNADLDRTRARIRHDLLPRLAAEYNPKVADALVRLGRIAAADVRALRRRRERLADRAIIEIGGAKVVLDRRTLLRLPADERAEVLRLAWRRAGWPEGPMTAARWLRLAGAIEMARGRASIGGGGEFWVEPDWVRLNRGPGADPPPDAVVPLPGSATWGDRRITLTCDADTPRDETIDADAVRPHLDAAGRPSLRVRAPRDGDRFDPLGLGGHSMALNDFLRGRGVVKERRATVALLCDRQGIVWVIGHRIAERVRRTDATTRLLGLRAEAVCD